MKKNTNAVVLIYALVLSILMRILSIVISNKQSIFIDNLNYNFYDSTMLKNIYNKADISSKDFVLDSTWTYLKIKWYIKSNSDFNNIFWSNTEINNFINSSSYNQINKIWNIWSWKIYLDIDNSATLKFVEFDKSIYNSSSTLKYLSGFSFSIPTGSIWYLTKNWIVSSWALADKYDFSSKDYAIFLSYNSSWASRSELDYLTYSIKIYDDYWSWIYINPIKLDSWLNKYLWYDIILSKWNYISKTMKLTK